MGRSRARRLAKKGQRLLDRQRWKDAGAAFQAAVDLDPTEATWHARLGYARLKAKNWTGAAHAYQAAIARRPGPPMWHYRLGQALEQSHHWTAAVRAYRTADQRVLKRDGPDAALPSHRLTLERRIDLSLGDKPAYAYGVLRGARLARQLGIRRIAAIELGVAGGNGLLALERHAATVEELTGVEVEVYGLDTGSGLLAPAGHRDMPYRFAEGNYAMDVEALTARLQHARLVLGDAAETFPELLREGIAPVGFLSFDMDLYTPTRAVLDTLGDNADEDGFLPRLTAYFDDVVGKSGQDYHRWAGELLAIDEFNTANEHVKITEDRRFRTLPINKAWHHGMRTMHRFKHPDYATYVSGAGPRSLRLSAT